jgi:hypothetical protein
MLQYIDAVLYPNSAYVLPSLPGAHVWLPSVDVLAPRNCEIESDVAERVLGALHIPPGMPYVAYAGPYDSLDHAEELLDTYLRHDIRQELALVIAAEAAKTNEQARLRFELLQRKIPQGSHVFVCPLPQEEMLLNVLRRESAAQIHWPRAGISDATLAEALWAGSPVVAMEQLGRRDTARAGVMFLLGKTPMELFDQAQRLYRDQKLSGSIVERARLYTWDYLLLDQELINLACFFLFQNNRATEINWT